MATVLLSAAGSAIGGSIGGSVLGIGAAAIGQAVGATVGGVIDNAVLGGGGRPVELGRRGSLRLPTTSEGAPVIRVIGRMRVAGQLLWSTRFLEHVTATSRGAKAGSTTVRTYSYTISFAVGICEGVIERIGRVWADGQPFDLAGVGYRLYTGTETQAPDPKIEAVEGAGNAPAYLGLAYIVFEDFPVGAFGNRLPVLNFEVFRSPNVEPAVAAAQGFGPHLSEMVQAVCLGPGTGEFGLETRPVRYVFPGGGGRYANVNNAAGAPDLVASLDQLEGDLPNAGAVSLVVAWFGDDLRCDRCQLMPRVEEAGRVSWPYQWSAAGLTTATAPVISRDTQDRPNFGGTPSDASVIAAIRELNARGRAVTLYPFILMDVAPGNTLTDPWTGTAPQPGFPWRGRITLSAAPGTPGSPDMTAAAATEVASFFGTCTAADFSVVGETVTYTGPAEWGLRRMVLHLAALAKAAGGVESICIGSELPGLTTIRSATATYPAVAGMQALAAEVRALLPAAKIGYAADWSEYFGHHPQDGSNDVLFHLDPLWADASIDFVGIDTYFPLADWRPGTQHLDAAAWPGVHDPAYLRANIEGGEGYDWFYADEAARNGQVRTPIQDLAHGEDWVWRFKDIRNWWQNAHHNRIGGVRDTTPTAWAPKSKPVRLTEIGCPAVDLGANEPNAFIDPASSESRLPHFSRGARDDLMQARFLAALIGYWADPAVNPDSDVYTGKMIDTAHVHVWNWDARPWPDFPLRETLWKDGPNFATGHWLAGRVGAATLAEAVAEIAGASLPDNLDLATLDGLLDGLIVDSFASPREIIRSLTLTHDFAVRQSGDRLGFLPRPAAPVRAIGRDLIVAGTGQGEASTLVHELGPDDGATATVQLSFTRGEVDFRTGTAEASFDGGTGQSVERVAVPVSLSGARALEVSARIAVEARRGRWRAHLELPPSALELEPGDEIELPVGAGSGRFRIARIREGLTRRIEAVAVGGAPALTRLAEERGIEPPLATPPAPVTAVLMDLPLASGAPEDAWPRIAVHADPWPGAVTLWRAPADSAYAELMRIGARAVIGTTATALAPGEAGRWQRDAGVEVALLSDGLVSVSEADVLNGANRAALEWPDGWEIVQFRDAVLVAPGRYALGRLLRGQRDTARPGATLAAGARFVLLDDAVQPLPLPAELRGLDRHYRAAASSVAPDHFSAAHEVAAFAAAGLRPFAPTHLRVATDAAGDAHASWIRATRIGGTSWPGEVPLGESSERYRVEIVDAGTVLRSATVTAPGFTYTAADRAADAPGAGTVLRVAQLSDDFGSGQMTEVPLDG